jgi:hypothetical protein
MKIIVLGTAFSCLFALSAPAQDATANIGPAPANSKQHKILTGALSPQTRQTLQEAMDSTRAAETTHPAPPAK